MTLAQFIAYNLLSTSILNVIQGTFENRHLGLYIHAQFQKLQIICLVKMEAIVIGYALFKT